MIYMILNFSPEFLHKILEGSKRVTLRKGIRKIRVGPCTLKIGEVELRAHIESVHFLKFSDVREEHAFSEGLQSLEELRKLLRKFYPEIKEEDWFTAIYFKLEKEVKDDNSEAV